MVTPPYRLPDEDLVAGKFNATVAASVFEQHYRLPDAYFDIHPPETEQGTGYLDAEYKIQELYHKGKSFGENEVGLKTHRQPQSNGHIQHTDQNDHGKN